MLHSIVKKVSSHPNLTTKKLNYYRSTLGSPLDSYDSNLSKYEDMILAKALKRGQTYIVLIKVKNLFADDKYNRINELNLVKAMKHLDDSNGFSYTQANVLVAYLRPNGKLVLTQGNHRAAKCYLTQGGEAYVVVNLIVHDSYDEDTWQRIEAINFNTDNTKRWNMIQEHKFKGGYVSGDQSYVDLYNFVKPFGVSIAGTNEGDYIATHTFESYGNLTEALGFDNTTHKEYVKFALHSLVEHLTEKDIKGFLFVGLVMFQKVFSERIRRIQKVNKQITFDDFIKYIFTERKLFNGNGPLTTQQDIVEDSGGIKIREFFASRFVVLFNEYCWNRGVTLNGTGLRGAVAIPESCGEWNELLEGVSSVKRRLFSAERF
jgi:hypothetical protein